MTGFIQAHAAAQVQVLIVDPNRGNRAAFQRDMGRLGLGLSEEALDEPLADGSPYRGRLLHFRRR